MNFGEIASALGAGLSTAGNYMQTQQKQKLAQQLEVDKEKRAFDNEVALTKLKADMETQKQAAVPQRTEIVTDANTGVSNAIQYNMFNKPLGTTTATAQQIADRDTTLQQQQDTATKSSLQDQLTQSSINKNNAEAADYGPDHDLDRQYKQASIANLQSEVANRGLNSRGKAPPTDSQMVDHILNDAGTKMILKDSDSVDSGAMLQMARGAMANAKRQAQASGQPVDPTPIFQTLLQQYLSAQSKPILPQQP